MYSFLMYYNHESIIIFLAWYNSQPVCTVFTVNLGSWICQSCQSWIKVFFCIGGFPLIYNIVWFYVIQIMYFTLWWNKKLCSLRSLALAKKSCININNSRAQVSRLCYFLWLCYLRGIINHVLFNFVIALHKQSIKKNFIYKEKYGTVTKVELVAKN